MAIRDDFFTALANGAKWDVGVSINRTNPLPLDQYSVFETEEKLNEYVAGAFSYPGQVIALVEENATTIYYLDQNKELQPVGIIPVGDDKTIEVTAAGAISLLGAAGAANGTLPMIGEDGKLTWKTLEDIGAGDGNDNTTYVFTKLTKGEGEAAECYGLSIQVKENGVATGDPIVIDLDVYTKSEIDTKVEALEKAIEAIDFMDADEVADAITEATKDFTTKTYVDGEVAKKVDTETYNTKVKALEDEDAAIRAIAEAVRDRVDAFLDGEGTEAALDSLQELIAYIESHDDVDIAGILEDIEALEGKLEGIDTTVAAYVTAAINALNIGDYAKAAALTTLAGRVETLENKPFDTYATKTEVQNVENKFADYTTTEALNGLLGNKANVNDVYTKSQVYNQEEIDELLENIQAGSSESAASVKTQLDSYKKIVNAEVWGSEEGSGDSRIDRLEAVGAQANVIESVVASETAKITATKSGKTVTIDDSALVDLVNKAQKDATQGINDAAAADAKAVANTTLITNLDTRLTAAEGVGNTNVGAIAGHETRLAAAEATIKTINETSLPAKADKSVVEALSTTVGEHTTQISTLGTNKADRADVYGKTETYSKTEIAAITGTIPEGSSLMAEIAKAQTAATYDDTAVKALIQGNTDAIAGITEAETGAIAVAKAEVLAEVVKVDGKADANADNIALNTAAIAKLNGEAGAEGSVATIADARIAAALAGADADFDTLKEMSDWLSEHADSAAAMNTAIEDNKKAIQAINNETTGILAVAKKYTDDEIAELDLTNKLASTLKDAKDYTDAQIPVALAAYKVKDVDGTTLQVSDAGVASVKAVSTDLLVQGELELILNGGKAN